MYKILIADDEANIREVVKEYGRVMGYEVDEAEDGQQAIDKVNAGNFDLVIMDIMMPNLDGFTACRKIRANHDVPVIMLSARSDEDDKLFGFDLGIDDYVTKPFSPKELMARIKVVLERHHSAERRSNPSLRQYDGLAFNESAHVVTIDEIPVKLTNKEYELLLYFIKNENVALSRERILNDIWGYDFYGDVRTIDTHVKMLRQSLGPYGKKIVTVHNVGYKFDAGK